MRIISGEFRGRTVKGPAGTKTRPTSDRLRETLFNILAPRINKNSFILDLCAGTGAIGIEAISRGAYFVAFVDKSRHACALIQENLKSLEIADNKTRIICSSAEQAVSRTAERTWDFVYYDPPYEHNYLDVLRSVASSGTDFLSENGVFVVEHHFKTQLPDMIENIARFRIVKQRESSLSFYEISQ